MTKNSLARQQFGPQADDKAKHGQTAIVDLHKKALLFLLLGHLLGDTEGVVEVKRPARDDSGFEVRKVSGLSTSHVVLVGRDLTPLFKKVGRSEEHKVRKSMRISFRVNRYHNRKRNEKTR